MRSLLQISFVDHPIELRGDGNALADALSESPRPASGARRQTRVRDMPPTGGTGREPRRFALPASRRRLGTVYGRVAVSAVYCYARLAEEAGFGMQARPATLAWRQVIESLPG